MKNGFALIVIIAFLFNCCTKKTPDNSTVLAEYTLGSGGNCTAATASGRFVADTALTIANRVTINVDVTATGPYWITTNTVNGISFSQVSTFTATGPQTVILTGTGTPLEPDSSNFIVTPISGPGGSCSFSVTTVQGTPPQYYLTCFLNGVYRNFSDSAGATNSNIPGNSGSSGLDVGGLDTIINSSEKIELGVSSAGVIGQGVYTDTSFSKAYFNYVDSLGQTWSVNSSGLPSFTINVAGVSTGSVQGTFSGTIKNQQGTGADSISITNGLFSVPLK
ncbi:MAG: hypothetical protein ACRDE8_05780 [Ginsengibacter sp.]